MTDHGDGRGHRRHYRCHIFIFALNVVINRIGVAIAVPTPVDGIDGEMLR
jgi:hypothetical protein